MTSEQRIEELEQEIARLTGECLDHRSALADCGRKLTDARADVAMLEKQRDEANLAVLAAALQITALKEQVAQAEAKGGQT